MTDNIFLAFLQLLIINGEPAGSSQATEFLNELESLIGNHNHVVPRSRPGEENGKRYQEVEDTLKEKTEKALCLFIDNFKWAHNSPFALVISFLVQGNRDLS